MLHLEGDPEVPKDEVWIQDKKTGNIARKLRSLDTGNGRKSLIDERYYIDILGRFNSEQDRGIMHTPEWKKEMRKLQIKFDKGELT